MTRKRYLNRVYARFFRGGEIRPAARSPRAVAAAAASSSAKPSLNAGGGWRRAPATLVAALVMTSAALPAVSQTAQAQEASQRSASPAIAEAPVATMRGMVRAGSVPLSDSMLASAEGGILEGVRGFIASILGGDLLPEITFKDATVAGVGGDELAYAYGKEAADIKGDPDETPHAGPGVELAEVPDSWTHEADGGAPGGPGGSSDGGPAEGTDFASPALGGDPGSIDDIASADPSEFGTDDLDSPPGGGSELASLGLPGKSPASGLTPHKSTPTEETTKETTGQPTGGTPAPQDAPKETTEGARGVPPAPESQAASQQPNPSAPPTYVASPPDPQGTADPEPGGNGAAPREAGVSPGYAGETVPGDEPPAESDPYAAEVAETAPETASGERPHAGPGEDGEVGSGNPGGHDPGGYVPGGHDVVSSAADDGVGVVPDDPTLVPADDFVEPDGEGKTPDAPEGYDESQGDPVQLPSDDGAAPEDESPGGESLDGVSAGQPEGPATDPDLDPGGEGEEGYPADDLATEDTSSSEIGGGTDGDSSPDIPQQDAPDPSQAQPGTEQGQDDSVSTDQPQDQPAPADTTTGTTADPTADGTDGPPQSLSEDSPVALTEEEQGVGSTPDHGQADAAPEADPADDPAAGVAPEPAGEQPGAGRAATETRQAPRTELAAPGIGGRDKGYSARRDEKLLERRTVRRAERRTERLAELRADRQAQRRTTVAGRRAERKADRLARGRARRQAAIAAAQDRSARKDSGRLERRAMRGSLDDPHGATRGGLKALQRSAPPHRKLAVRGGLKRAQRASVRHREAPEDA